MKDKIFPPGTPLSDVLGTLYPRPGPIPAQEVEVTLDELRLLNAKDTHKLLTGTQADAQSLEAKIHRKKRLLRAMNDLKAAWGFDIKVNKPMKIAFEPNDCSRLHKLSQSIVDETVSWWPKDEDDVKVLLDQPISREVQSFVVKDTWTHLLGSETLEGEFRLPFDLCAFEFRVNKRTVIVLAKQDDNGHKGCMVFYETAAGEWLNLGEMDHDVWTPMIRGICVMLEAEVAVREVKRVPHKLAAKRAASGKLPMYDFHTLSLAKRFRTSKGAPGNATGAHKRLHFVRGHWRHYEEHKTWIKWHLRGDESLGFADKNYKV